MRLLATPPPPPQTAEFGWGSQQEANKTKMKKTKTKKTKTKTKTNKTKKDKKEKNEYHFDDLVKSNILSFINQPPLVKIVSNKYWSCNSHTGFVRRIPIGEHATHNIYLCRDVSRHIDIRKTKKALGIKGAGKLKVFVASCDSDDFDERAQTQIVYKYDVMNTLGMDERHPQGKAYVVFN